MNWDPLPEMFTGLISSPQFKHSHFPNIAPVIALANRVTKTFVKDSIALYRPAGGIHILLVHDVSGQITDGKGECIKICDQPNIYFETNLNSKKRWGLKMQAGDKLEELMIFPGVDPLINPWCQGQLLEAAKDIARAERVVVIGYRYPLYDYHMRDWMKKIDWKGKSVIVVNPESEQETYKYLQENCRGAVFKLEKKKFEESSFA